MGKFSDLLSSLVRKFKSFLIPSTRKDPTISPNANLDYLCFAAKETLVLGFEFVTSSDDPKPAGSAKPLRRKDFPGILPVLECSTDRKTWTSYTIGDPVQLKAGAKVYFRGDNRTFSLNEKKYIHFKASGRVVVSGRINSLLDKSLKLKSIPSEYAFYKLFFGTEILTAPELPATELTAHCYDSMFAGCPYLQTAPVLPAETLAEGCYANMFTACMRLSSMEVKFTDWNAGLSPTEAWCGGVSKEGTFICPAGLERISGVNNIPEGWAVEIPGEDTCPDYLCFTAGEADSKIGMEAVGENWELPALEYSTDRKVWKPFVIGTTVLTLAKAGDKVYLRGNNSSFSASNHQYVKFTMAGSDKYTGNIAASGNIMSLVDKTCGSTIIPNAYAFNQLFDHCFILSSAPSLPATTLTEGCYCGMFVDCNALSSAPSLPATILAKSCYDRMFMSCNSLASAPLLPADSMAENCYSHMFYGCELTSAPALPAMNLAKNCYMEMFVGNHFTAAPSLPATSLAEGCYDEMFSGCSSLVTGPRISATALKPRSCWGMFIGCRSLNCLEVDFTAWDDEDGLDNATDNWMSGVPSTGSFKCPVLLTDTRDASHVPSGWTIVRK